VDYGEAYTICADREDLVMDATSQTHAFFRAWTDTVLGMVCNQTSSAPSQKDRFMHARHFLVLRFWRGKATTGLRSPQPEHVTWAMLFSVIKEHTRQVGGVRRKGNLGKSFFFLSKPHTVQILLSHRPRCSLRCCSARWS
jgi:hypothetical protein